MELPEKIKEIENKVVRNELKEALELLQNYCEDEKIEVIRNEVITHLSNLKNLQQLNRSNQIDKDKYLTRISKISGAILVLKDQYAHYVENPNEIPENVHPMIEPPVQENSGTSSTAVQMLQVPNQPFDLFKKVLILLVVLFGVATLYFIYQGLMFQSGSSGSMLLAVWGAKIHDDNSKFRLQKLLLEQNAQLQNQS